MKILRPSTISVVCALLATGCNFEPDNTPSDEQNRPQPPITGACGDKVRELEAEIDRLRGLVNAASVPAPALEEAKAEVFSKPVFPDGSSALELASANGDFLTNAFARVDGDDGYFATGDFRRTLIAVLTGLAPATSYQPVNYEVEAVTEILLTTKASFLRWLGKNGGKKLEVLANRLNQLVGLLPEHMAATLEERLMEPGVKAFQEAARQYPKFKKILAHHDAWAARAWGHADADKTFADPCGEAFEIYGDKEKGLHNEYEMIYGYDANAFEGSVAWWMRMMFDLEKQGISPEQLSAVVASFPASHDAGFTPSVGKPDQSPAKKKFRFRKK